MEFFALKSSSAESVETDVQRSVTVQSPTQGPSGGPDAFNLDRNDFPHRAPPPTTGTRDARYQAVIRQSVLDEIHLHGKSSMKAEVCGVLIGDIYSDLLAPWSYIEHCIRGNDADGSQTQVTITSETWSRIHETLETKYPGKKIVGWYHTHPGFGVFLSGMDLFIQDNFFNQPWQIASVYDPHSEDEGVFVWRGGKSVREAFLVENDLKNSSGQNNTGGDMDELRRRVRRLERRLDFILTGFLLLILIALVAPLVLIAFAPEVLTQLPNFHRSAAIPSPKVLPAAIAATHPVSTSNVGFIPANSTTQPVSRPTEDPNLITADSDVGNVSLTGVKVTPPAPKH